MDLTCTFGGERMASSNGYFEATFFPSLLVRNAVGQFRYLDVVQ
jgi:hypothetical protein